MIQLKNLDEEEISVNTSNTEIKAQESRWERNRRLSFDLEARTIWVEGEIEADFGCWFQTVMFELERLDKDAPVTIWLCTPGGDVTSSYQFYDMVRAAPFKVTIIGHGEICSAGVIMLACGHERLVMETCALMAHEYRGSTTDADTRYSEAKDRRQYEDWLSDNWFEAMARHTKWDAATWRKKQEKKAEIWLLGAQAIIDVGIADGVYNPHNMLIEPEPRTNSLE